MQAYKSTMVVHGSLEGEGAGVLIGVGQRHRLVPQTLC